MRVGRCGREALVQRLRAARVIRDGDEQLHARRGRRQELQLRQERRAPLVLLRRHERVHQQQRLTRHEGVGLDLFGLRPPLRVRRRPPVDAGGQLVHLVLLGAPSSYRCLVPSRRAGNPGAAVSSALRGPAGPGRRSARRLRRRRPAARPPRRLRTASRRMYSTWALTLRSSSAAHFSTSAHRSGSTRSRYCLRTAIGYRSPDARPPQRRLHRSHVRRVRKATKK